MLNYDKMRSISVILFIGSFLLLLTNTVLAVFYDSLDNFTIFCSWFCAACALWIHIFPDSTAWFGKDLDANHKASITVSNIVVLFLVIATVFIQLNVLKDGGFI